MRYRPLVIFADWILSLIDDVDLDVGTDGVAADGVEGAETEVFAGVFIPIADLIPALSPPFSPPPFFAPCIPSLKPRPTADPVD